MRIFHHFLYYREAYGTVRGITNSGITTHIDDSDLDFLLRNSHAYEELI